MYKAIESVDKLLEESEENTVFVIKHSLICPISEKAKLEIDTFAENNTVYLLIIQEERETSEELAQKLQIRHESPQFIEILNKKAIKVLNHYQINLENLK